MASTYTEQDQAALAACHESAARLVAEMLTKQEHLDNLDQIRMKIARKKATVESQLRSAVQTQLDGVDNGLDRMRLASDVVQEVKESMLQVEKVYQQCEELSDVIGPIKEVNRRFQQLRTTSVHINNIFGFPDVMEEIRQLMDKGDLLRAHQYLSELEQTRNELLVQLYQSSEQFVDKNTALHRYFEPLNGLSVALGQQLWMTMNDITTSLSEDPTRVVTAMRIIWREEKADKAIMDRLDDRHVPISQIPGRPKGWLEKCVQILETAIDNKFEEHQPQDRVESQEWLDDYLQKIAGLCYADLKTMKEHGASCFPPSFPPDYDNILDFYIFCYCTKVKKVIGDLVSQDLNARDIIRLMIWIGDIRQSFREVLDIDLQKHGSLIDEKTGAELQETCLAQVEGNIQEIVQKMLEQEKEDWKAQFYPDADNEGHYYTTVGVLLFEMVDQNISVLASLESLGLPTRVKTLKICLKGVEKFQEAYKVQISHLCDDHKHSERREPPLFFIYVIAIANNCKSCIEFSEQLKQRFDTTMDVGRDAVTETQIINQFKRIAENFEVTGQYCCDILLDDMFADLQQLLDGLFTKEQWLKKPLDLVTKLEGTLVDYNEDLKHLKQTHHSYLIVQAQNRILKAYLEAMMKKKVTLKRKDDRLEACDIIQQEAKKLENVFLRLSHAASPKKHIFVIEQLAELLKSGLDTIPFNIKGMVSRYPDVKLYHIVAVLAMRGDLNKNGCTKLMDRCDVSTGGGDSSPQTRRRARAEEKSLLAQIVIQNPYSLF